MVKDVSTEVIIASTEGKLLTLEDVKKDVELVALIQRAHEFMRTLGFTEHGFRHAGLVGHIAENVLQRLGHPERTCELASIAGYMHDIGNCVHRQNHAQSGALMAFQILARLGLSTYEAVPQIEIAFGDNRGAIIIRHMEPLTAADEALLKQFGSEHTLAVYLQPKGPDTVHCLYSPWGEVDLTFASVEGLTMHFRPTDFTQVNLPMNRMMLAQTLDWLKPEANETVLDLFCGLGNFTLALARHAANVTGVEGSQDMAEQGYRNAGANGLDNVQFYAANLHDIELFAGAQKLPWDQTYDCVVLDPPRTGAEEICRTMKRFAPARILYVSCNPATLARDAGILATQGYRLKKVGVMDMFPHTTHVESMALFEKS